MKRQTRIFCCASGLLLALAATTGVQADELPARKAGLWEMKMMTGGASTTTRQCTTPAVEKGMQEKAISNGMECSKLDIRKTSSGYVIDSACKVGDTSVTSHSEFTGDFNSAYTMKQTGRVEIKGAGMSQNMNVTIEARWLGDCPPDWEPGEIEVPGGGRYKMGSGANAPAGNTPKGPRPK